MPGVTLSGPHDAAGFRDGPRRLGWRVRQTLVPAAAIALVAWTMLVLRREGVAGAGSLYLATTTVAFLGIGDAALRLAGARDQSLCWLGVRYVVGFSLTAFLVTLLAFVGLGGGAVWVALALAGGGWLALGRDLVRRRSSRPAPGWLAGELLVGAFVLRLVVEHTGYWVSKDGTSYLTQYWDDLYHLAMIKDGLSRGLPLRGYALEAGVGRVAYHPAVDTMATVFIAALRLPVDAAYFRFIMPILLLAVIVSVAVLAAAWGRSHLAGVLAVGMIVLTLVGSRLRVVGSESGLGALRFFVTDPPAAIGCVGAASCLALVALADADSPPWTLVLAGLIAGATTLMATPIALVFGPAFVGVMLFWALRRPAQRPRFLAAALAAIAAAAVSYPTTTGASDGLPAIRLGGLGRHLLAWHDVGSYSGVLPHLVAPLRHLGLAGSELFVFAVLLFGLLGWHLVVLLLALWRGWRHGQRPFAVARLASWLCAVLVVLVVLVGIGLGQRGDGPYAPWNIAIHTISILWWVGVAAAAVALVAALRTVARPPWLTTAVASALAALVVVVVGFLAFGGMARLRHSDGGRLPTAVRLMLEQADARVPARALIVQSFELRSQNWVSALAGRRVVLERDSWGFDLFPAQTARLRAEILAMYATRSPVTARDLARTMGADYALVGPTSDSLGLREISAVVLRRGGWVLVRLPPP